MASSGPLAPAHTKPPTAIPCAVRSTMHHTRRWLATGAALAAALAGLTTASPATASPATESDGCPQLTVSKGWYGDNQAELQRMINDHGTCSGSVSGPNGRPVAAFDWDNTVVKNDI